MGKQEKDYQVSYRIEIDTTDSTNRLIKFGEAVGNLVKAKSSLDTAVTNIRNMLEGIDQIFRTKTMKRRKFDYKLNVDTGRTEEKLGRVKTLLEEIGALSKGIKLIIGAGQPLESKEIKKNAKLLLNSEAMDEWKRKFKNTATASARSVKEMQKSVTKVIGKLNAALISLSRGRDLNIQTSQAKERLLEILSLLTRIKGASKMTFGLQMNSPGLYGTVNAGVVIPYAPGLRLPDKVQAKLQQDLQKKLYTSQQLHQEKQRQAESNFQAKLHQLDRWNTAKEAERKRKEEEQAQKKAAQAAERQKKLAATRAVQTLKREKTAAAAFDNSKRRAAISRIQYSRLPSMRNLPFISMLNAYMGYSLMRSELTKAIEYSNIMESAHSILRVADGDLSTFEDRFERMGRHVRQIGVETKFTAVEIAGAVKFLSMAGMGIDTINKSIRPIANLALIGDNDVAYIADLATNIMAGYDIQNESMDSVADIIASTVSHANVNVIEMAESYKMAAGYLRTAGVEFSEASAAIGLLGNMGLKGTLAGTSLRALSTRFAKPTKEGQDVLNRLGIRFTEIRNLYGKEVERLRPIADIFQDLHDKKASMSDMQTIFGRIGGNAAMMFVQNYDKLRELTAQNKISFGISAELAHVKQETTKGLWAQVTSQMTESFMKAYEILEPMIRKTLHAFLEKFKAPEITRGIVSIGQALLDVLGIVGNIASWFVRNYHWLEPLIFTGVVATRLFKLAGALTNFGVALGFVGKQAAATSSLEVIQSLTGLKGWGKMSFANKRAVVSALNSAGVTGKGALKQALISSGGAWGARSAFQSLFTTQVSTGTGLTGAAASLSAMGASAAVATAGITALVGALGWVAYKTWQIKEAKDAMQEDLKRNEKYRYPSIEALKNSLRETYQQAIATKNAVDEVVSQKTIEEASGQSTGAFTKNWWLSFFSSMPSSSIIGNVHGKRINDQYSAFDAYQRDVRAAINTIARRDSQKRIDSALAELGKLSSVIEINAFIKNIRDKYGQAPTDLQPSLWREDAQGRILYVEGLGKMNEAIAAKTLDYAQYQNTETVNSIKVTAESYLQAMKSQNDALRFIQESGFNLDFLSEQGFVLDKSGYWKQKKLGANATDEERTDQLAKLNKVKSSLTWFAGSLRSIFGGSVAAAEHILQKAGFMPDLYSNEPGSNDLQPFNANPITNGLDDGGAGGNYSGTGKLSSAAPKQVIVNISNLMSVGTIDLMKSKEGQQAEIQNLKEQLAQALIDVVHDFDASWNG